MAEPTPDGLRATVRAWLEQNWHPGADRFEFLESVVAAGYAVPRWPVEMFGLGLASELADVIEEEFARAGAPGAGQDLTNLWAGTLRRHAPAELRDALLRRVLAGGVHMCLLYSEPGAGSDLAGLQTRADADGDGWSVTGQKVWTSNAHRAEYGFLLARTDWDVPKHEGISFFLLPMRQPGVEVRPLRQITGESHFNEVFIDHARVPSGHLLGQLGGGWAVLQTALSYERAHMAGRSRRPAGDAGSAGQATVRPGEDLDILALAVELGAHRDPLLRQELARVATLQKVLQWNAQRARDASGRGRETPLPLLAKLAMSRFLHQRARLQSRLLGAEATLDGPASARASSANFLALNAYFTSIGGGTDEIQHNIIGERLLGLPREPATDRGVPFRQVLKATNPRTAR
ncbi:acyl-CoA dehydrogenase family protein [Acidiferrimicrobium sp. IK]|uniref:acyl-CoA dehydrogenase family protein n=1 Tax=Acidiferrimicrobium sp. IK TaxID=2871700 RepID=UPI0021CAE595|nr:acyl-CoA dehydrogenase family protein [Acidiferrimicrobium sp. IK]MCU4186420.1 acyl-CoA dehydrogenase family protein [Acidiferrimicrobium sp. IK]